MGWLGITCDAADRVVALSLPSLPPSLALLPQALFPPASLFNLLSDLEHLDLSGNPLAGPLPDVCLPRLRSLDFSSTAAAVGASGGGGGGTLPQLRGVPLLRALRLGNAGLVGNIPPGWAEAMPDLELLELQGNNLSGEVDADLLATSEELAGNLAGNYQLCGPFERPRGSIPWDISFTRLGFPCV